MVEALRALVEAESPTDDPVACLACVDVVDAIAEDLLGMRGERVELGGRVHLRWRFGTTQRVLLIGHLDTVWPVGTLARWPFELRDGHATGPGVFDMKAGVVQLLFALAALDSIDGVAVLLTTDEETGSPTARPLIEETASGIEAALVLEPSAGGALKTERKGVSLYRLTVRGRAAHAGLDPEKGANAAVELAHQLLAVAALARPALGTTVTPSLVSAGTAVNTVPAEAAAAGGRARPNRAGGGAHLRRLCSPRARRPRHLRRLSSGASRSRRSSAAPRRRSSRGRRSWPASSAWPRSPKPLSAGAPTAACSQGSVCRCSTASAPSATMRTPKASTSRSTSLPSARRWWPRSCRICSR